MIFRNEGKDIKENFCMGEGLCNSMSSNVEIVSSSKDLSGVKQDLSTKFDMIIPLLLAIAEEQ